MYSFNGFITHTATKLIQARLSSNFDHPEELGIDAILSQDLINVILNRSIFSQISCWGRNIFMGYLNKELETKDVMTEEEWLSLGHVGFFDSDDFLTVHGKPDSFIKLTTGELVVPHKVTKNVNDDSSQTFVPRLMPN